MGADNTDETKTGLITRKSRHGNKAEGRRQGKKSNSAPSFKKRRTYHVLLAHGVGTPIVPPPCLLLHVLNPPLLLCQALVRGIGGEVGVGHGAR